MDILDKLVSLAQISGSVDVQCLFQGGWYVRHEARRGQALVHIVTDGEGWLQVDGMDKPAGQRRRGVFSAQNRPCFEQ